MEREKPDNPYEAIGYGDFGSYFKNKKIKLQLQQDEIAALMEDELPQIFEGVIVYVNGYTDPPIHEIRNMIVQRGGEFTQFLSKSRITHIIASNLTQSKMKEFRNYKVAKPEWVTESVKANKLLPWHNFSTIRIPGSLTQFRSGSQTTKSGSATVSASGGSALLAKPTDGSNPHQTQAEPDVDMVNNYTNHSSHQTTVSDTIAVPSSSNIVAEDSIEIDDALAMQDTPEAEIEAALEDMDGEDSFFEGLDLDQLDYQLTPPTHEPSAEQQPPADITPPEQDLLPFTQVPIDSPSESPPQPQRPQPMDPPPIPIPVYKPLGFNPYTRAGLPGMMPIPESENTIKTTEIVGSQVEPDSQDNRHPTIIELSVPWNRQNCSIQPGFVEKFYQSSRLHYLSTWKAKLRDVTTKLQKDRPPVVTKSDHKTIMHIDFDCFFASVATRGKPELQVKPIAVAHGTGGSTSNSEIASCNYLARDFGVKNGMQLLKARTLCPDLVVVPYEFQQYEDISIEFYKILLGYADELQAVSVDEALVDISSKCLPTWGAGPNGSQLSASRSQDGDLSRMNPAAFALKVREEIFLATGCHASVGIGPNILLAKLSTKRAKPHGQYIWPSPPGSSKTLEELQGAVPDLIEESEEDPSPPASANMSFTLSYEPPPVVRKSVSRKEPVVKDLPGVGYKISQDLLERLNVRTLHQLQQVAREQLQVVCGMKTGDLLYNSCRGIDETTLAADRDKARQSVSAEISWGVRFENHQQVDVFMRDLAQEVSKRLKEIDRKGKSIVLKIMKRKAFVKGAWKHLGHGPVDQFARTGQLPLYTDDPDLIANEALRLLNYFRFDVLDLRGLGIQVLKLNNDVVNTVSKAAFAFPETKNQTTLTSAMFQQKSTAVNPRAVDDSEPSLQPPSATAAQEPLYPTVERRVEPEKPIMEIDKGIFKELPKDIQDELLRDHNLVFLNEDISDASGGGAVAMVEGGGTSVAEQQSSVQKHELTPWSQLDPRELMVLSTPAMRNALKEYAELKQTDRGKDRRSSITDTTSSRPPPATTVTTSPGLEVNDHLHGNSFLPSPSKLDRSVLQALPPEIRAEIEQEYTHIMENHELIRKLAQPGGSGGGSGGAGTSTGLQSRALTTMAMTVGHDHLVPDHQVTSRPKTPGRGKPRGRPLGSRARGGRGRGAINEYPERVDDVHHGGGSTTGTNVQAQVKKAPAAQIQQQQPEVPELDADFLAALPQDIRAEVEAAHRVELIKTRRRQEAELAAQRDAASAATRQGSGGGVAGTGLNERQQGPVLERPTLMGKREIGDLRVLLTQWVQSTLVEQDLRRSVSRKKDEAKEGGDGRGGGVEMTMFDEGPNPDDVQSFVDFVARVLVMERDLERVRLLLRYLRRRIEDNERQIEQDVRVKGGKLVEVGVAMTWRQAFEWVLSVAKQLVVHIYGGSFDLD